MTSLLSAGTNSAAIVQVQRDVRGIADPPCPSPSCAVASGRRVMSNSAHSSFHLSTHLTIDDVNAHIYARSMYSSIPEAG